MNEDPAHAPSRGTSRRLLFIIDSLGAGGAQNQLSLLAAGLAGRGHDVAVAQYFPDDDFGHRLDAAGVTRHRIARGDKLGRHVVGALRRLVARGDFDVVTSYMDRPGLFAAAATLGPGRPPLAVSHRAITRWSTLGRAERALRRWTNRRAARIVCNSHHERLTWEGLLPGADVRTIWNGLPAAAEPPGGEPAELESAPGDERPVLLSVGTISPRKNLETLVDALAIRRERGAPSVRIACLGAPKRTLREDLAYDAALRERIVAAGLEDDWHWIGHQPDPWPWYRRADALVHLGLDEGLPNVVCEAQCARLPVLVGAVLDHPRMVEDGTSGFLCDPHDAASVAEAIDRFVALDADARTRFGDAARRQAESAYSMTRLLDEHEALFDELVGGDTGTTRATSTSS